VAFLAGHKLRASEMDTIEDDITALEALGTWVAFTPAWESDGTDPAIGNGSLVGRYCVIGKRMDVVITMTAGSTTTFGTGAWYFVMNFPATIVSGLKWVGTALTFDAGTTYRPEACFVDSAVSAYILRGTSGGNFYSATVPQTWTTNDWTTFRITVEIQ
jgi:hypothetical protein